MDDLKKKVIVTGGAGFIGSHLAEALAGKGYETHVIDTLVNGRREDVPADCVLHEIDVTDTDAIAAVMKDAHAVFHLAALPRVGFSYDHPEQAHRANVDGTFSVLVAARNAHVRRVIYAGSSSVYGRQDTLPLTEDMHPHPQSLYAFQKLAGEGYARLFSELYGLRTVSLRFFTVYGSRMRPEGGYALAIPAFLSKRREGKPLQVTGDGTQTRDFTHVTDVVRACMLAMESPNVGRGEVMNISAGRNVSLNALAEHIGGEREYLPQRPGDMLHTLGDTAHARELLGWEPSVRLEEGIDELKREWGIV